MTIFWHEIASPVGPLLLSGDGRALTGIHFNGGTHPRRPDAGWVADAAPFAAVVQELAEYFAGTRQHFSVPLAPSGTDFQRRVWRALTDIPYGETIDYGELAGRIGNPKASRAVGLANGRNPLPIVVPCHRVIGRDGSLTGFGGGLPIKRALLTLEGAACMRAAQGRLAV